MGLTPILTMVRFLPMVVTGILWNAIVILVIGRLALVWIEGAFPLPLLPFSLSTSNNDSIADASATFQS